MKPWPFTPTPSNFANLESRALPRTNFNAATEWAPRRMLTLEDEVGHVRPGRLPYIRPPVKFGEVDHRVSQAEQQEEDAGGKRGSGARLYAWTLIAVLAAIALGHYAPEIGQFFLTIRK